MLHEIPSALRGTDKSLQSEELEHPNVIRAAP